MSRRSVTMAGFYARLAPAFLEIIELILVLAALGLILFRSHKTRENHSRSTRVEQWFSRLARRKSLSVLVVGLLVLVSRVCSDSSSWHSRTQLA